MKIVQQQVQPSAKAAFPESGVASKDSRAYLIGKRILDVSIALPVVIFLLPPLMLLVALVHLCFSRGTLFFRQQRCGKSGHLFSILKFRTMTPVEASETSLETSARIFPLGDLLRLSKIDEIPQFVNVLRGEMSIVGPRPHHLQDCQTFGRRVAGYQERLAVKPGITGLAQVREYAGEFEWDCTKSRVDSDLEYIASRSLVKDIRLILQTAGTVLEKCLQKLVSTQKPVPGQASASTMPFPAESTEPNSDQTDVTEAPRRAA